VILLFDPTWNVRSKTVLLRGETEFRKSNNFFLLHRQTNQAMLYLGQKMRLHFTPWNTIVVTRMLAARLVYSKQYFLIVK
jgi:hypothetical protein